MGLDEFHFNFIKSCWGILKVDVLQMTNEFHRNDSIPRGANVTFVTLSKLDVLKHNNIIS